MSVTANSTPKEPVSPPEPGLRLAARSGLDVMLTIPGVPTISRFHGITVAMYFDDPRDHWQRARAGETLREIDPLR